MRKNLTVGILKETKSEEYRAPLTPTDIAWFKKRKVGVEVESSSERIFKDREYKRSGAKLVERVKKASLLVGIKEPELSSLHNNKVYLVFSHTIKGQAKNIPLIKECLKKKITLVDYEKITDQHGKRLVYFGRFAGICGMVNSLYYYGKKLEWRGVKNPFSSIHASHRYISLREAKKDIKRVADRIYRRGVDRRISPFIIGVTGHGHVSQGVKEILDLFNPIEIHPRDIRRFIRHQKHIRNRIYKIGFHREEKFRSKTGGGFYFEDYLKNPKRFESNLDVYIPHINILIHAGYWDRCYPKLITKAMVRRLYKRKGFRLGFIGDISCDVNGGIELTHKTTTQDSPTFSYDPRRDKVVDGYKSEGITILARDNLPTELPRDASKDFSDHVREYIYQIAAHGVKDIANHMAITREIRQAVIIQNGRLTKPYQYLRKCL